jgi:hypothetical protein
MLKLCLFLCTVLYCMQPNTVSEQLKIACQQGYTSEILDILAENPTLDPDVPDETGKTPLNYLVLRNGSLDAIEGLLAANADPLKRCGGAGLNSVDRALLFKRRQILDILLTDCNLHGRKIEVHPDILKRTASLDPNLQQAVLDAQLTGHVLSNIRPFAQTPKPQFMSQFFGRRYLVWLTADEIRLNFDRVGYDLPPDNQIGILDRLRNMVRRIFS